MKVYISKSPLQTKKIAEELAKKIKKENTNHLVALTGDLGSGKTTFTQGFAKGLGIKDKIISPSFVLIKIHKIPKNNNRLFHIDLYRLENSSQIQDIGLIEILNDSSNISIIEWAEKIPELLPKKMNHIVFKYIDETTREIRYSDNFKLI